MVGSGRYIMVSEPILDFDVGVYYAWPRRGCLSVSLRNPMGHNEDVVSGFGGGGICHIVTSTLDMGETSWYYISMDSS